MANTPGAPHLEWLIRPLAGSTSPAASGAGKTPPGTYVAPESKCAKETALLGTCILLIRWIAQLMMMDSPTDDGKTSEARDSSCFEQLVDQRRHFDLRADPSTAIPRG